MKGFIVALLVAACAVALVAGQDPTSQIPGSADQVPGMDMATSSASTGSEAGMDAAKSVPGGDMAAGVANQASSMAGKRRRSVDAVFEGNFDENSDFNAACKGKKG